MTPACSKCGNPPTDGNPVRYVNGVGTCAKCSVSTAYPGNPMPIAEGAPKVDVGGSAEVVHKPAQEAPGWRGFMGSGSTKE